MAAVYDLIILGAGCAGLSLAEQLANHMHPPPSTLILDPKQTFSNDRTWCFWQTEDAGAAHAASHAWQQFEVRLEEAVCVRDCAHTPYVFLSATDFYQRALAALAKQPACMRLQLQSKVIAVVKTNDGLWQVSTDNDSYFAKAIVDTRPPAITPTKDARMWQSFYGVEVQLNSALFNPARTTLMKIDRQFSDGLGFLYVLPTSPQHALLEYTVFAHTRYTAQQLKPYLAAQISALIAENPYETLRDEYGALPMGHLHWLQSQDDSYVYAGLYAGGARASSGYSFLRIQRWASACAKHLAQHGKPLPMPRDPVWLRWMDQLFLSVLLTYPAQAPVLFYRFFSQPSVAAIAHFMNDRPSFKHVLQIIAAMPKWLFLRSVCTKKSP